MTLADAPSASRYRDDESDPASQLPVLGYRYVGDGQDLLGHEKPDAGVGRSFLEDAFLPLRRYADPIVLVDDVQFRTAGLRADRYPLDLLTVLGRVMDKAFADFIQTLWA